jgi:hypothetical protein
LANNLSNYAENKLLDHILGTAAFTMPTLYLALFTSDPTDAGTGTEVSVGGYTRMAISFSASSGGSASNDSDVLFPVATATWGTISHIGIYDNSTAGNLLWHGPLSVAKLIDVDDEFKLGSGRLTVSMN